MADTISISNDDRETFCFDFFFHNLALIPGALWDYSGKICIWEPAGKQMKRAYISSPLHDLCADWDGTSPEPYWYKGTMKTSLSHSTESRTAALQSSFRAQETHLLFSALLLTSCVMLGKAFHSLCASSSLSFLSALSIQMVSPLELSLPRPYLQINMLLL